MSSGYCWFFLCSISPCDLYCSKNCDCHSDSFWNSSFFAETKQSLNSTRTFHIVSRGQFHQHSTNSFYAQRSQKRITDCQVKQLFALLGSVCVKAASKHVDEIDPRSSSSSQPGFWPAIKRERRIYQSIKDL